MGSCHLLRKGKEGTNQTAQRFEPVASIISGTVEKGD